MKNKNRARGSAWRLLGYSLVAGAGVIAAPGPREAAAAREDADAGAWVDEDEDLLEALEAAADLVDPAAAGDRLGGLLAHASGFDATRVATTAALSSNARVRRVLAEALAAPFRLVGDDFVLDQLARDEDADVRASAARALRARRLRATIAAG